MSLPQRVQELMDRFQAYREEYESPPYLEARVRVDFLNPLFSELGWDVENRQNRSEAMRDVVTEGRIRSADGLKAPDYLFRAEGTPAFVLEAKRPSVNLRTDPLPALQLRRYGWNSKRFSVGILTDFQEFAIYDCTIPPAAVDMANVALLDYCTFDQYGERWDDIAARFARTNVIAGSLAEYVRSFAIRRGQSQVDKVFLGELNQWRSRLATALAASNELDEEALNYATQLLIDRIIFLRVCEDRGTEEYGSLRNNVARPGIYARLHTAFQRADEKYNSGLFHLRPEPGRLSFDSLTPTLSVPDDVLKKFIERLYWPQGPYDFAVFPADVLGQVYEQFLGQKIGLDESNTVKISDKPEVRKAGGVYYTPTLVVRHIVAECVHPRLENQTPEKLARKRLRICDPACGSGTFLVEVYQHLLDWHLDKYVEADPGRWARSRPKRLHKDANDRWRLTVGERKRILVEHVFGVDIDPQAVEVAKLSLLLKLLEGENEATLGTQFELFHERVLPDLERNVKCGNSLVGSAFHLSQGIELDDALARKINAFDWEIEFPHLETEGGFDVIMRNPPWLMAGYYIDDSLDYLRAQFTTATGKFDLYYVFLEQSLRLLAVGGSLGMIVPNKFFHTHAAKGLRELLVRDTRLRKIKDFGLEKVFEGATNYSCVLVAERSAPQAVVEYSELNAAVQTQDLFEVPIRSLSTRGWHFQDQQARELFEKLQSRGTPLEKIASRFATGIQSGADKLLTFEPEQAAQLGIEPEILRPILRGRDVRAWASNLEPKLLLFPYRLADDSFTLIDETELARNFPKAYTYLLEHRETLQKRVWFDKDAEELSGAWYGLMYVERASSFSQPHILTPSLSLGGNFAPGRGQLFVTGTAGVTGIVGSGDMDPQALLGILNSNLLSAYIMKTSPIYQGGFRKYSAPYLKSIPIKVATSTAERAAQAEIARLVDQLDTPGHTAASPAAGDRALRQRLGALREIENQVAALYDLSEGERRWVARQMKRMRRI